MKLRRFNTAGIAAFQDYLAQLRADPKLAPPEYLLEDDTLTETISPAAEIEHRALATRHEAGQYLWEILGRSGINRPERDKGLWPWLSLLFFDSTCPVENLGQRDPGADARHIAEIGNFRRFYRHLLLGPFIIFRAQKEQPEAAGVLLCQKLNRPGDVVEQLSARQQIISNRALLGAATILYVDTATGKLKRGSQNKTRGSALRLEKVANQFDVNWYLYAMQSDALVAMLPREFNKFRPGQK